MLPPLNEIRVLDLTRLLPGPVCSLMLADQGADVIKIEQPGTGDYARWYIPRVGEYAALFHALNRNKRSVTLDLKQAAHREAFLKLVETADVVIESFRPNVLPRLGLDYAALKAVNPRLILCSLSGYGQTGAYADVAGHDLNFAALTGILAAGNSQPLPIQVMDYGGAMLAAFAIVTALFQRERTGEGAHIDAALMDAGLTVMTTLRAESFARAHAPQPAGELLSGGYACYRAYTTADGRAIVLAALEEKFWRNFCLLVGRDDLARVMYLDPEIQGELIPQMEAIFAARSYAEWVALLAENPETCANPISDVLESASHPAILARDAHYEAEGVAHTRIPFRLGERPPHRPAPALGADTADLLREVGYSEAEITAMLQTG